MVDSELIIAKPKNSSIYWNINIELLLYKTTLPQRLNMLCGQEVV